jgi:UDP-N-acetylglucosamine/UDP-N-acetyl-alpha-D-glucosaminouronate 4-epimerase
LKILITGGAGFIGSHLAEALCRRGDKVVVVDDLSSGSLENLAWCAQSDALEFVQGDAGHGVSLKPLLEQCDCVFHLAAMPSVRQSINDPLESNRRNLETTLQLLVAARDARVGRVVFASSSSVYGEANAEAKQETSSPVLLSPYAVQKCAAEQYAQLFHRLYALPVVTLRYFNVFGPRQDYDSPYASVVARFCKAVLNSRPITIYGDGQQSRDFTYIDNVISANLLAAAAPEEKIAGRIFDCATGTSVSVLELADALAELSGGPLAQCLKPSRIGDIRDSRADISALERELGYRVLVGWKEGLQRTLDFYRLQTADVVETRYADT